MKTYLYQMLRSLSILLIGVLLVACREETTQWIVVLTGAVFFIVGLITVLNFFLRKSRGKPAGSFPLLGIGGVLLGLILMLAAGSFIRFFMYVMGAVLILVSIYQLIMLVNLHKQFKFHSAMYLAPMLAMMFGIFALWNPTKVASLPLLLIGLGCIVSGVGDIVAMMVYGIHRSKENKLARKAAKTAQTGQTGQTEPQTVEVEAVTEE